MQDCDITVRPAGPRSRRPFSLIEVLLALIVITFGVVSVLALLPASLKSGRESVSDTHSSQIAEHVLETLGAIMENALTTSDWSATALTLPTAKPGVAEPEEWTACDPFRDPTDTDKTFWDGLTQAGMATWRSAIVDGEFTGFLRLDMRRPDADYAEFAALCRVWRTPVTVSHLDGSTWETTTLAETDAVGLQIEVGWPAQAPYAQRQKALYALNVFRKGD